MKCEATDTAVLLNSCFEEEEIEDEPLRKKILKWFKKPEEAEIDLKLIEKQSPKFFVPYMYSTNYEMLLLIIALIANVITGCMMPAFLITFGDILGDINTQSDYMSTVMIMFLLAAISFTATSIGTFLLLYVGDKCMKRLRIAVFTSLVKQDIEFYDSIDSGSIVTKMDSLIGAMKVSIGARFGQLVMFSAMVIGSFIVAFVYNWELALVIICACPLLAVGAVLLTVAATTNGSRILAAYSEAGSIANEALLAIRTVVSYGIENYTLIRYRKRLLLAQKNGFIASVLAGVALAIFMSTIFLTYALGCWYSSILVADALEEQIASNAADNSFPGQNAITCFMGAIMGAFGLGQIAAAVKNLIAARSASQELLGLLKRKSKIDPIDKTGLFPDTFNGKIEFRNLKFKYPTRDNYVFKDLSFIIEPGSTVALVGESGCGKSTISQLLHRFYDIESGSILIDDRDIKEYNVAYLRSNIGFVRQEPTLFNLPIWENIAIGAESVGFLEALKNETEANTERSALRRLSFEEEKNFDDSQYKTIAPGIFFSVDGTVSVKDSAICKAGIYSNCHEFVMKLPQKYDTCVGQSAAHISGGQKQRIAIAQAMLLPPKILVLDEATSALDNHSEKLVQNALDNLLNETKSTTIIIAHRLSTVQNADKIIVLDKPNENGSIVREMGTHQQLLELNGLYARLVKNQILAIPEENNLKSLDAAGDTVTAKDYNFDDEIHKILSVKNSVVQEKKPTFLDKLRKKAATADDNIAVLKYTRGADEEYKEKISLKTIYADIFKDKFMMVIGSIAAIAAGCIFPLYSVIFSKFFAMYFFPDPDLIRQEGEKWAAWHLVIAGAVFVVEFVKYFCAEYVGQRLIRKLRDNAFSNMLYQEISFFDNPNHTVGQLNSVLSHDTVTVKNGTVMGLLSTIQVFSALASGLVIAFLSVPQVAAVILALYVGLIPAHLIEARATFGKEDDSSESGPKDIMHEVITNIKVVNIYCLQFFFTERYQESVASEKETSTKNRLTFAVGFGFSQAMQYFTNAIALWYGAALVQDGSASAIDVMKTIFALTFAAAGIGQAMIDATAQSEVQLAAENVYFMSNRKSLIDSRSKEGKVLKIHESKKASVPQFLLGLTKQDSYMSKVHEFANYNLPCEGPLNGYVEIKDLSFRYPTRLQVPVYKNLSVSIKPGETVAFVGSSGCGKSTLVQLLQRFYDICESYTYYRFDAKNCRNKNIIDSNAVQFKDEKLTAMDYTKKYRSDVYEEGVTCGGGDIKIDNISIQDINVRFMRGIIGLVGQEPVLFDCSISQNICYGNPNATQADIEKAAQLANAHEFILRFEKGYDTVVGKSGMLLSGGQKQRIAVARAIIRNPQILILDEATSALDSESEQIVQKALDELIQSRSADSSNTRSTIIIAHRLSTIRNANKIIVLDNSTQNGSVVVEQGTHDLLMAIPNGYYMNLVRAQCNK